MNSLTQELEKINQTHEATVRLIQETPGIPGSLMKEYERGFEQYSGMYYSIEAFIAHTESEDTIANFRNQQVDILKNWIAYEENIQLKLGKV